MSQAEGCGDLVIKRNPAADRPLGALYVMDEAQTLVGRRGSSASTEISFARRGGGRASRPAISWDRIRN
jgi:hypothetical protein